MTFVCFQCKSIFEQRIFNRGGANGKASRNGRPWKHTFCSKACYNRWRADVHLEAKRKWLLFQRKVWGTTEAGRFEASKAKSFGRRAEILARKTLLPRLGFSEIDDFSGYSNQFFVDFIATLGEERVLVDATIKLKAYFPEKVRLALSLRMRLFVIHVSPVCGDLYVLNEILPGRVVSRVSAAFIREKYEALVYGGASEDVQRDLQERSA